MTKILAINAGSSSLKFQLIKMPEEEVITKGIVERIGLNDSIFQITVNGEKKKFVQDIPNHAEAVKILLEQMLELHVIESFDEIDGVGHRVVHGGEKFSDSALITDEVLREIEELADLAPLHNPANVTGIKAFKEVLPDVPAVAVFERLSTKQCLNSLICTAYPMNIIKNIKSASMDSTEHPTNMLRNEPLNS